MLWRGTDKPLVLLTGKTGQIGSELEKQLGPLVELVAFDRRELDLEKPETARGIVRPTQAQHHHQRCRLHRGRPG